MKKYLIKGLLALVVGGFTASCADKDGDYVPVGQQKATAYADAFKELIGGEVAPNHDWGFKKTSLIDESSQARTSTRTADVNSNEWVAKGYNVPGEISQRERDVVMQWFRTHENPQSETVDIHNYFIQNVGYTDHTYPGEGVELKDNNGHDVTITNPGRTQMDYIFVGPGYYSNDNGNTTIAYNWDNGDDHVNNFNAGSGQIQHIIYSGSEYFGFHDSYGAGVSTEGHGNNGKYCEKNRNFVIRFIEVDGVVGCYVGFNYESGKTSEGWHLEPDGFFDDRVIKLVAAEGEIVPPTPGGGSSSSSTSSRTDRIERRRLVSQGRIFCEDLGTDAARMTKSDIDFNDAVFDAKIWRLGQYDVTYVNGSYSSETDYLEGIYDNGLENGKFKYIAEIRLLAAGGTVQLKIGGDKGFEIHEKFGEGNNKTIGHTTIINTMGAPSQANFSTTVSTETCDAVTVEVDITSLVAGKSEIGLDIIPIDVLWVSQTGQSVGELTADFGKAPQKLCVPIGTPWVYERIPITDAYKDFAAYATSRTPLFWDGTKNESLLYPSLPEGMTPETGETGNVNTNPYHDRVVTEGQTVTETITETILWEGELAFAENTNGSDFTPSTLSFNEGDYIRIYGSTTNSSNNRVQIAFVDNTTNGWLTKKPYDQTNVNFTNGYVEGTLDATDISNLAGVTKFGVWGINVTITKISKVVKTRTTN